MSEWIPMNPPAPSVGQRVRVRRITIVEAVWDGCEFVIMQDNAFEPLAIPIHQTEIEWSPLQEEK